MKLKSIREKVLNGHFAHLLSLANHKNYMHPAEGFAKQSIARGIDTLPLFF